MAGFVAVVSPAGASQSVAWSVAGTGCSGASCGTIDASGLYTAPPAVPTPATVTVTARSVVDSTKSANATVTIVLALSFSMNPSTVDFGTQMVNTTSTPVTVTMTNTGSIPQPVSAELGGYNWTDFAMTTNCPSTIGVGASCTFTVTFTPATTPQPCPLQECTAGRRVALLTVDGINEEMGEVKLFGTGTN
jgi:hypothetical protein